MTDKEMPFEQVMKERRLRLVFVEKEYILSLVTGDLYKRRIINLRTIELPTDAVCIDCHYQVERDGFVLVVGSREFEPVPQGYHIEYLFDEMIGTVDLEELALCLLEERGEGGGPTEAEAAAAKA